MRAALFYFIRLFFRRQGFLEVDTPLRQPVYIPESTIVPVAAGEGRYLQTSPELAMKRLLASGCDRIFQLCPCFRGGEVGRLHLEEFQMLEWYRTGEDYSRLMSDCQELLRFLLCSLEEYQVSLGDPPAIPLFAGLDLAGDWPRLTVEEAFLRYSPLPLATALQTGHFEELLVEHVEPRLAGPRPVFLYAYPVQLAALARKSPADPGVAERFELYVQGIELANGFSELTDEKEQRRRFEKEIAAINASGDRQAAMPEKFLEDLGKLEGAAGIALGIDRLFMLAMNYDSIGAAVSFAPEDF